MTTDSVNNQTERETADLTAIPTSQDSLTNFRIFCPIRPANSAHCMNLYY